MTQPHVRTLPLSELRRLYATHTAAELVILYGSSARAWYEYMRRRGIHKQPHCRRSISP